MSYKNQEIQLQLALDRLDWDTCFTLVEQTFDAIHRIEIGTGVIKEYGMPILREMKRRFPDKVLVADMKTCDAGAHETRQALDAGADVTTVMASASNSTLLQALDVAAKMNREVMVDLLEVKDSHRVKDMVQQGVTSVSLHRGKDQQSQGETADATSFHLLDGLTNIRVAVAGGLHAGNLHAVIPHHPDTVIVGSGITGSENPAQAAAEIKRRLKDANHR